MSLKVRTPTPSSWLFGHGNDYSDDPLGFTLRYGPAYGDVVRLRFGRQPVFLLNTPEAVEHVYVRNARNYVKDAWTRQMRGLMGKGLLLSEGEFWLRQRRLLQPAFHRERTAEYAGIIVATAERWMAAADRTAPFELTHEMLALTLAAVARSLLGADIEPYLPQVARATEAAAECLKILFDRVVPLPDWVPTPVNRRLRHSARQLDAVVDALLASRRRQPAPARAPKGLIDLLLDAVARGEIPLRQVRDEIVTLLLAGHETTALALIYTLRLLALHPQALAVVHAELDEVLEGRPPSAEDLPRLPHLEAVLKESLRLYPPVWASSREALAADTLGDVELAPGALILVSMWALHRAPQHFPEAERFLPERWRDGLSSRLPRCAYFPFGGGPRMCIGGGFAMTELRLALAALLRRHRIVVMDQEPVKLFPTISLRPACPILARLEPRVV